MATPFNSTFVQYDGQLFNETLMKAFNYTLYSNGTLSNASHCYLAFGIYEPYFLPNGTVKNGTACDSPIKSIESRGGLGVVFGVLFALMIVLALTSLSKHGKNHLPMERRFRLVSRRWTWYWLLVTATVGIISGLTAIDVDRDYLQGIALILQNVFYYVMLPASLASIWEMTRHWGSLCERILVDEDAFKFRDDDRRSKIEFYLPLVFYLFGFLCFFLSVLRSWTPIEKGSGSVATDPRFRASSIFALLAFFMIIASFINSIYYYPPVSHRPPFKIPACLTLILIRIAYNIACAWDFQISPLSHLSNPAYIYVLGYLPILAIMAIQVWSAWKEPNDDNRIKMLRRERELAMDRELGIGKTEMKALPKATGLPKAISGWTTNSSAGS